MYTFAPLPSSFPGAFHDNMYSMTPSTAALPTAADKCCPCPVVDPALVKSLKQKQPGTQSLLTLRATYPGIDVDTSDVVLSVFNDDDSAVGGHHVSPSGDSTGEDLASASLEGTLSYVPRAPPFDRVIASAAEPAALARIAGLMAAFGSHGQTPLFDPALQIFSVPDIVGVVGFKLSAGCAVVFGDPLCSPDDAPALAAAFRRYCASLRHPTVYIDASPNFANQARSALGARSVCFGVEQWLNPVLFQRRVRVSSEAKKLVLKEYRRFPPDPTLEQKILECTNAWLEGRTGVQVYTCKVQPFVAPQVRRWVYAMRGTEVVGVLGLLQLGGTHKGGYVVDFCLDVPDAPKDTTAALVLEMIKVLKKERCQFVSWGVAPKANLSCDTAGGINRLANWFMCKAVEKLKLHGKYNFRKKFCPHIEEAPEIDPSASMQTWSKRWRSWIWRRTAARDDPTNMNAAFISKQIHVGDGDAKAPCNSGSDAGGERDCYLVFDPPTISPRHAIAILSAVHVTQDAIKWECMNILRSSVPSPQGARALLVSCMQAPGRASATALSFKGWTILKNICRPFQKCLLCLPQRDYTALSLKLPIVLPSSSSS